VCHDALADYDKLSDMLVFDGLVLLLLLLLLLLLSLLLNIYFAMLRHVPGLCGRYALRRDACGRLTAAVAWLSKLYELDQLQLKTLNPGLSKVLKCFRHLADGQLPSVPGCKGTWGMLCESAVVKEFQTGLTATGHILRELAPQLQQRLQAEGETDDDAQALVADALNQLQKLPHFSQNPEINWAARHTPTPEALNDAARCMKDLARDMRQALADCETNANGSDRYVILH